MDDAVNGRASPGERDRGLLARPDTGEIRLRDIREKDERGGVGNGQDVLVLRDAVSGARGVSNDRAVPRGNQVPADEVLFRKGERSLALLFSPGVAAWRNISRAPESAASLSRATIVPRLWPRETGSPSTTRSSVRVPANGARNFCCISAAVCPGAETMTGSVACARPITRRSAVSAVTARLAGMVARSTTSE